MLRVTIELVPHGDEAKAQPIARGAIANTGEHDHRPERGVYDVGFLEVLDRRPNGLETVKAVAAGEVLDFDRINRGPWELLYEALRVAVAKDQPHPDVARDLLFDTVRQFAYRNGDDQMHTGGLSTLEAVWTELQLPEPCTEEELEKIRRSS